MLDSSNTHRLVKHRLAKRLSHCLIAVADIDLTNSSQVIGHWNATTAPPLFVLFKQLFVRKLITNYFLVQVNLESLVVNLLLTKVAILSILARVINLESKFLYWSNFESVLRKSHLHMLLNFDFISWKQVLLVTHWLITLAFIQVVIFVFFHLFFLFFIANKVVIYLLFIVIIIAHLLEEQLVEPSLRLVLLGSAHGSHTFASKLNDVWFKFVFQFLRLEFTFLATKVKLIVDAHNVDC